MTSTGFRWKFHGEVVPNLDLEVWIKFGPEDITRRVFICREEHMLRQGSSKGLSIDGGEGRVSSRERARQSGGECIHKRCDQITKALAAGLGP